MALVGAHQQTSFANPQNGQSPMDADVVRNNDNAVTAKHNSHDNDATLHVQTGLLANRPVAGTVGAMFLDENGRFYRDNGAAWNELPYARLDAVGVNAFASDVDIGGDLTVYGLSDLDAVDAGAITATSVTAGTFTGNGSAITGITVTAPNVTAGTFAAGNFAFQGNVTASSGTVSVAAVLATSGQMRAARTTQTGAGGSVSFSSSNHVRHTMTGNGTLTLTGGVAGGVYTVEVLQDGTGGRTVTWSGATWDGGSAPTLTTTANRKSILTFYYDGSNYCGVLFGRDFASTA